MPQPNLADEQSIKSERRRLKDERKKELEDIKSILGLAEGKRFVWRLLEHCKVFNSIWDPSSRIHYQAGMQDVGHFLMAEVTDANPAALLEMIQDNKKRLEDDEHD